ITKNSFNRSIPSDVIYTRPSACGKPERSLCTLIRAFVRCAGRLAAERGVKNPPRPPHERHPAAISSAQLVSGPNVAHSVVVKPLRTATQSLRGHRWLRRDIRHREVL